jgi:hypothetical protein
MDAPGHGRGRHDIRRQEELPLDRLPSPHKLAEDETMAIEVQGSEDREQRSEGRGRRTEKDEHRTLNIEHRMVNERKRDEWCKLNSK